MFEAMRKFLDAFYKVVNGYEGIERSGKSSYYKRGCPYQGIINDDMDGEMVERFIRAMIYPPYPVAKYKNKEVDALQKCLNIMKE